MLYFGKNGSLKSAVNEKSDVLESVYSEILGPDYKKLEKYSLLLSEDNFKEKQMNKKEMGFTEIKAVDIDDLNAQSSKISVYSIPMLLTENEQEKSKDKILFKYGLPYSSFILYAIQDIPILTACSLTRRLDDGSIDYTIRSVIAHFSLRFRDITYKKAGLYTEEPRKLTKLLDDVDDKNLLKFCTDWDKIISKVPTNHGKNILKELISTINVEKISKIEDFAKIKNKRHTN